MQSVGSLMQVYKKFQKGFLLSLLWCIFISQLNIFDPVLFFEFYFVIYFAFAYFAFKSIKNKNKYEFLIIFFAPFLYLFFWRKSHLQELKELKIEKSKKILHVLLVIIATLGILFLVAFSTNYAYQKNQNLRLLNKLKPITNELVVLCENYDDDYVPVSNQVFSYISRNDKIKYTEIFSLINSLRKTSIKYSTEFQDLRAKVDLSKFNESEKEKVTKLLKAYENVFASYQQYNTDLDNCLRKASSDSTSIQSKIDKSLLCNDVDQNFQKNLDESYKMMIEAFELNNRDQQKLSEFFRQE